MTYISEIWKNKGVSDLEMCMDYFALPGRKYENLFSHPNGLALRTDKPVQFSLNVFWEITTFFLSSTFSKKNRWKIQIFTTSPWKNNHPYKFLNLRHLYKD